MSTFIDFYGIKIGLLYYFLKGKTVFLNSLVSLTKNAVIAVSQVLEEEKIHFAVSAHLHVTFQSLILHKPRPLMRTILFLF